MIYSGSAREKVIYVGIISYSLTTHGATCYTIQWLN